MSKAVKIVTPNRPEGVVQVADALAMIGINLPTVDDKVRMLCPCCSKRIIVMPMGTDWAANEDDLRWLDEG